MTLTFGASAGNKDATSIHIGTASGVRTVTEGWIGTASGNRQFYSATPALTVVATPETITWFGGGGSYYSSSDATATPYGGTPPYSYAWSVDNGAVSMNNPGGQSTAFFSTDGGFANATCTVTDSLGAEAVSNNVTLF
jgi:hypothetical protein